MEPSSFFKKIVGCIFLIFSAWPVVAFDQDLSPHDNITIGYGENFQAIPASAPWIVDSPHHQDHLKKQMHPALKGFLRFLIVSVGTLPVTVGLSSLIYLYPPPGWTISQQTGFALLTGSSLALTVGFVDLIINAVVQGQRKKKD
ncbi:MAG: hypothetical protein ACRCVN_00685 [Spirochaetia bacterium]